MVRWDRASYVATMPYKHNATRRHRIPRARYRVRKWRAYEAGLQRRGDLTLWVAKAALAGWRAARRSTPGGQSRYPHLAIKAVLSVRLVFHLALRQAMDLAASVLRLLGLDLPVPDHTTLSRRGRAFAGRQASARTCNGPMHLVLDSTGFELFGQGGWDAARHGRRKRQWRKSDLAVDATTGEIASHVLTAGTAEDAHWVPDVLRTIEGTMASLTADGAYDGEPTYAAARARQPDPPLDVVIPPRASAVPSTADPTQHTARDRNIRLMARKDRMEWQRQRPAMGGASWPKRP